MKSKFNVFIGFLVIISIVAIVAPVMALNDANDYTLNGTHVFDKGAVLDVKGTLKINGTAVTATAAQLNAAATGTVTNGTLTPLVVSNAMLEVVASNITASTSVTLPAASIAHSKLVNGGAGACIITNMSTLCTNIMWFNVQGILTNKTTNP